MLRSREDPLAMSISKCSVGSLICEYPERGTHGQGVSVSAFHAFFILPLYLDYVFFAVKVSYWKFTQYLEQYCVGFCWTV